MSKIKKSELLDIVREQGSAITNLLQRVTLLEKPQLKQLDQSVFNNMHERWKFAAIDADGSAHRFSKEVFPYREGFCYEGDNYNEFKFSLIGTGYDASNWQNSLIERDIARELLEVDLSSELTGSELCKAMLARGDKCVLIRMGVRDDKQAKDIGRFAIATSIDESGRFNVMSDQQPISKVDFAVPINNQGEPLTASEVGL